MIIAQADSLVTQLAEKVQVSVFVLIVIVVVALADFVARAAVATLNDVHQMRLAEKIERAQNG